VHLTSKFSKSGSKAIILIIFVQKGVSKYAELYVDFKTVEKAANATQTFVNNIKEITFFLF
jgi:hypothetical protein